MTAATVRAGDESTRARMLSAAVECILEEGYYRASSNRIAQRAGVTWGVIQYHFGTREQLLLAVVRGGAEDLLRRLQDARVVGATVEARLDSLAEVIWDHYGRPEFLAHMQVLLNLSKDPRTSEDTVAALAETERQVGSLLQSLVAQVAPGSDGLGIVMFELMRGAAIGEGLREALPRSGRKPTRDTRESLVRALALLVERG
ncbi:MAG: regulatory protein TetR [Acidimicrobiales bacterium]|nr:regulatory protein TetR [Acidimicrobiales bacterium]